MLTLESVAAEVATCQACKLCEARTKTVPGEGSPQPKILFTGEGPGEEEDRTGRPFVGRAGELLNEGIQRAGLRREEVFISNIVKCRPPGNRNPQLEEMDACFGFWTAQYSLLKPQLIVALGKVAAEYLLQRTVKVTRENGQLDFLHDGTAVLIVLHPAYVLRNQIASVRESFFQAIEYAKFLTGGHSTHQPTKDKP